MNLEFKTQIVMALNLPLSIQNEILNYMGYEIYFPQKNISQNTQIPRIRFMKIMFSIRKNKYYKINELYKNIYMSTDPETDDENYTIEDDNDYNQFRILHFKMEIRTTKNDIYMVRKVENFISNNPEKINIHIIRYSTEFSYHTYIPYSGVFYTEEKYLFGNYFEMNEIDPNDKRNGVYHTDSDRFNYFNQFEDEGHFYED